MNRSFHRGEKSVPVLAMLCSQLIPLLYFTPRSFIMTKRDSQIAELPSPRDLRMALPDIDMSVAGLHSYTTPATPGPDSHPQASSSTTPSSNNPS